ncbi:MAG: ribose transport system substrate-binding protein [Solirubrobacteraceae bacterium]|nr:ribose transport system substrate-binding protein [Solirubrobacteraceae bacterium]
MPVFGSGVSTTEQRIQGFLQEIKKYPNIKPLATQYVGDNPSKAAQAITALYSAHPDLPGVFATNVLVAQGVDTGLKTAGVAKKVKIIGYDADPTQVADLKSGDVAAHLQEQLLTRLGDRQERGVTEGLAPLSRLA